MSEKEQFDILGENYKAFVENDPIRNFLHYPSVISHMTNLRGARVLDVGCGDGAFCRMLAQDFECKMWGFDIAPHLIELAKDLEKVHPLGVRYVTSTAFEFHVPERFDYATSTMVLSYALNTDDLEKLFASAFRHLLGKTVFISVTFNPAFTKFNELIATRIFEKYPDLKVQVNFLDLVHRQKQFASHLRQYSKSQYEAAALRVGFSSIEWFPLFPNEQGVGSLGEEFWKECIEAQPYIVMVCKKS